MKEKGRSKKGEVVELRTRTKEFALRIIRLYSGFPKQTEAQVIGRQMIRSGTSVGANYREAYRARSKAEFISKVGECLKEIEETGYWLELLVDSAIVSEERVASLTNECSELTAIFVASIRKAKSNEEKEKGRKKKEEGKTA